MTRASKTKKISCEKCEKYGTGWTTLTQNSLSQAQICECITNCPQCEGAGFLRVERDSGYVYVNPCTVCGDVRRNVRLYNNAGIPGKFCDAFELSTYHYKGESQRSALNYVDVFVKKYPHKRGFLLMGAAGLGKTHLSIASISQLTLQQSVGCIFKDFFYLLSDLKNAYTHGHSENEVIEPLVETEVLVIDELAKGKSSDWELNILDQLISKRYNASKITIATTNYISADFGDKARGETLEDRVGERIASRIVCSFL